MKKRKAKSNSENKYDTFSITMELERPLLYNDENNTENNNKQKKEDKSKIIKRRIITLLTVLIIFVIGFFIWLSNGYSLQANDMKYLQSNSKVEVTVDGNYTYFTPKNVNATKGFIFYPGERVDSSSYAKLCNNVASYGYKVVAVDMPFNYANFGKNKATKVIEDNPQITKWVIGGDSIGGTVACEYAVNNKNVEGIVLISSYPRENISELGFKVLSLWGSKDNVVDYKELINSKEQLPKDTKYVEIEGANHSQFANYGMYSGDEEALISSDEQMDITVRNIVNFLYNIQ
ncbi:MULTISPECIES: alpha/beta hydrolase [Terrisporobacter]|uniref:Alpha/beta hydrolase n=1 Tax=Terrisporobacter muris TaxID=2963284 RepID=A0A9X2S544_9FIRM|nr:MULTISPECIES: alpha/beta hydrolase [Terrisporobacter]MCR1824251.1 alpha/beta hydrolase [Terrisporobacter muris]MDY3374601.1 alpha/beta hydrolase [Terrisporobacter othiniensis]